MRPTALSLMLPLDSTLPLTHSPNNSYDVRLGDFADSLIPFVHVDHVRFPNVLFPVSARVGWMNDALFSACCVSRKLYDFLRPRSTFFFAIRILCGQCGLSPIASRLPPTASESCIVPPIATPSDFAAAETPLSFPGTADCRLSLAVPESRSAPASDTVVEVHSPLLPSEITA